jgi:hypothetical protein
MAAQEIRLLATAQNCLIESLQKARWPFTSRTAGISFQNPDNHPTSHGSIRRKLTPKETPAPFPLPAPPFEDRLMFAIRMRDTAFSDH